MVLIVEDDENTRELYLHVLRQSGIACIATGDAPLALRWARAHDFEVVLMDLGLPHLRDGLQLAAFLRTLPNRPPLIAVTGYHLDRDKDRLFNHALRKPIDAQTLVDAVRRFVPEQSVLPW